MNDFYNRRLKTILYFHLKLVEKDKTMTNSEKQEQFYLINCFIEILNSKDKDKKKVKK